MVKKNPLKERVQLSKPIWDESFEVELAKEPVSLGLFDKWTNGEYD